MVRKRSNRKRLSRKQRRLTKRSKRLSRKSKSKRKTKRIYKKRLSRKSKRKKKNKKKKIKKRGGMKARFTNNDDDYDDDDDDDVEGCLGRACAFRVLKAPLGDFATTGVGSDLKATWGEGPTKEDQISAQKYLKKVSPESAPAPSPAASAARKIMLQEQIEEREKNVGRRQGYKTEIKKLTDNFEGTIIEFKRFLSDLEKEDSMTFAIIKNQIDEVLKAVSGKGITQKEQKRKLEWDELTDKLLSMYVRYRSLIMRFKITKFLENMKPNVENFKRFLDILNSEKKIGELEFEAIKNQINEVLKEVSEKGITQKEQKRKLEWDELTKIFFYTGMEKIYDFCIIEYENYLNAEEIFKLYIDLEENFNKMTTGLGGRISKKGLVSIPKQYEIFLSDRHPLPPGAAVAVPVDVSDTAEDFGQPNHERSEDLDRNDPAVLLLPFSDEERQDDEENLTSGNIDHLPPPPPRPPGAAVGQKNLFSKHFLTELLVVIQISFGTTEDNPMQYIKELEGDLFLKLEGIASGGNEKIEIKKNDMKKLFRVLRLFMLQRGKKLIDYVNDLKTNLEEKYRRVSEAIEKEEPFKVYNTPKFEKFDEQLPYFLKYF